MKKTNKRQYGTNDHDVHTMSKAEYDEMHKQPKRKTKRDTVQSAAARKVKVYYHNSPYGVPGDRIW